MIPPTLDAFVEELAPTRGVSAVLDRFTDRVLGELRDPADLERMARRTVEGLALAMQAALLLRDVPARVGDAFVVSRIGPDRGTAFGALPAGIDVDALLTRAG